MLIYFIAQITLSTQNDIVLHALIFETFNKKRKSTFFSIDIN